MLILEYISMHGTPEWCAARMSARESKGTLPAYEQLCTSCTCVYWLYAWPDSFFIYLFLSFFLRILSKRPSGWLGSGMRRKKEVIIVKKNNDYDAVWWSERSMKLCGAHII